MNYELAHIRFLQSRIVRGERLHRDDEEWLQRISDANISLGRALVDMGQLIQKQGDNL